MQTFRSINDILQYAKNNSSKFVTKEVMAIRGQQFEQCLHDAIQEYLDSYTPVIYHRTGHLLDSLSVDEPYFEDGEWKIRVYFANELAMHPSIINPDNDDWKGLTPVLLDQGWHWHSSKHHIDRFTDYSGSHFIDKAKQLFEERYGQGIQIKEGYV